MNASHELSRPFFGRLGARLRQLPHAVGAAPRRNRPPAHDASDLAALCREARLDPEELPEATRRLATAAERARDERQRAAQLGARILTIVDPGYPPALHHLDQPPPVLYLRGAIPRRPGIAIVGSRQADRYGLDLAERFGRDLAARGIAVVSGFARGVDTAAHRGALAVEGGRTVACLGCGLDLDYPRGSRTLARSIAGAGAVVTELPLGYPPLPHNFPIRNRLIAALSLGTLVVRATLRSGSLITARLALELGRDVYAIPGRLHDPRAEGTLRLIQDGALLARSAEDIVASLPLHERDRLPLGEEGTGVAPAPSDPEARRLHAALPEGSVASCEELAERSGLAAARVLALLLRLELEGWVRRHPGPVFSRAP